ncbi:hypothetical protein HGG74_18380 [Arthrobacter sp. E918]|uniref:Uncharacterized protein n=1 Tax=Arthrobacter mobilis TaxID=2724944 RepID=A0A7X6K793_9MICC|nr:hypothetical protein [Arthrobacter mobilis]
MATAQGLFNLLTGLWPLVHYRSFEAVTGPKTDQWLVKCVGGLGAAGGYAQLRAGTSAGGKAAARRLGAGMAATFAAIDLVYAGSGRISRIYLLDAVVELGWLAGWAASASQARKTARRAGQRQPGN